MSFTLTVIIYLTVGFIAAFGIEHDYQVGNKLMGEPVKYQWGRVLAMTPFAIFTLPAAGVIYMGGLHLDTLDAIREQGKAKERMARYLEKIRSGRL